MAVLLSKFRFFGCFYPLRQYCGQLPGAATTTKHTFQSSFQNNSFLAMTIPQWTSNNKFATETVSNCWKCGKEIRLKFGQYTCNCGVLQPPPSHLSLFDVMGEDKTFNIDQTQLTNTFRELQSRLHPDKFSNKPQEEQEYSQKQSTLVNKAYRTLQDPLLRGLYLLEMHGESIGEDNKDIDQSFLVEIMELNEELADIDSPEKYTAVLSKNKIMLDELFKDLSDAFDAKDIVLAKKILIKLKYYSNLKEKLKEQRHLYEY